MKNNPTEFALEIARPKDGSNPKVPIDVSSKHSIVYCHDPVNGLTTTLVNRFGTNVSIPTHRFEAWLDLKRQEHDLLSNAVPDGRQTTADYTRRFAEMTLTPSTIPTDKAELDDFKKRAHNCAYVNGLELCREADGEVLLGVELTSSDDVTFTMTEALTNALRRINPSCVIKRTENTVRVYIPLATSMEKAVNTLGTAALYGKLSAAAAR